MRTIATRRTSAFEHLETRQLLCALHDDHPIELRPDLVGSRAPAVNEPADIVWINRGLASDGFDARFGTSAPLARAVVDAVIIAYERMIGSFNYSTAGAKYQLTLSMNTSGSGFGASAGLNGLLNNIPHDGSITMGAGNGSADPNDVNGWFMDSTPFESSEFQGNITNAFSGDAQAGSPAAGKGDFYTVVAAEMTHCMGMSSGSPTLWTDLTTNTGIADTAEGGGVGKFWVFRGPSIHHLLTSNNGGPGGQERTKAVHAAGPNVPVVWDGETYYGAQDQGNAVYEFSRRYIINNTFAMMFHDAYNYASVNPAKWGTFYSILNESTGVVTVRGGASTSIDRINISRSGSTISVSVDPTDDIPGTGALPGFGDLPAFVTQYDVSQVSSIVIQTGDGNDIITLDSTATTGSITINAGNGNDTINVQGTDGATLAIQSSGGLDTVNVNTDNTGTAAVQFDSTMNLAALNIGSGGVTTMTASGSRVLVTNALSITGTGKLDLTNNDMIVEYSGATQLPAVQALINAARNGGLWNGSGIFSATAATNPLLNTTLGAMEASDFKSIGNVTFDGQAIDDTAVVIKYTYYGDANFNGQVDGADYARADATFNQEVSTQSDIGGWFNGDFDGNGKVDGADYALMDAAFNNQGAALRSTLPAIANRSQRSAGPSRV